MDTISVTFRVVEPDGFISADVLADAAAVLGGSADVYTYWELAGLALICFLFGFLVRRVAR